MLMCFTQITVQLLIISTNKHWTQFSLELNTQFCLETRLKRNQ